jgi:hypothetical protein
VTGPSDPQRGRVSGWRWFWLAVFSAWVLWRGVVVLRDDSRGSWITWTASFIVVAVVVAGVFGYLRLGLWRAVRQNSDAWFVAKVAPAGTSRQQTLVLDAVGLTLWSGSGSHPVDPGTVPWGQVDFAEAARLPIGLRVVDGLRVRTQITPPLELVLPSGLGVDRARTIEAIELINKQALDERPDGSR